MIGIIDYGSGNVGNIRRALLFLKRDPVVMKEPPLNDPSFLEAFILPGVGAFGPAVSLMKSSGWLDFLDSWFLNGRPLLGICLGMQLLCEGSAEGLGIDGLGIFKGRAEKLQGAKKIPHIGWNTIHPTVSGTNGCFYFVHSYALPLSRDTAALTSVDSCVFTSVARRDNVIGFQFHPERSGFSGLKLLDISLKELEA